MLIFLIVLSYCVSSLHPSLFHFPLYLISLSLSLHPHMSTASQTAWHCGGSWTANLSAGSWRTSTLSWGTTVTVDHIPRELMLQIYIGSHLVFCSAILKVFIFIFCCLLCNSKDGQSFLPNTFKNQRMLCPYWQIIWGGRHAVVSSSQALNQKSSCKSSGCHDPRVQNI